MALKQLDLRIEGDIQDYLSRSGKAIDTALAKNLLQAALHLEGEVQEEVGRTFPSGRTGELRRSYRAVLLEKGGQLKSAGVFSDLVYAEIQDQGGTITPKARRNLSIPVSMKAKTPGLWPRHWPKDQLFLRVKFGKAWLGERMARGKVKVHYVLKPSVTIKGKFYLRRAADNAAAGVAKILGDGIDIELGKVT